MGMNSGGGGRNVSRVCEATAQRLRHVLGRTSDDQPLGKTGLNKNESDHILSLMAHRGDQSALLLMAAVFQVLADSPTLH